ncbi:hypothetical protein NL676_028646 [Syzygium grande]|nr:hypothetical protein NL676_028646 [Syzygium grande]
MLDEAVVAKGGATAGSGRGSASPRLGKSEPRGCEAGLACATATSGRFSHESNARRGCRWLRRGRALAQISGAGPCPGHGSLTKGRLPPGDAQQGRRGLGEGPPRLTGPRLAWARASPGKARLALA